MQSRVSTTYFHALSEDGSVTPADDDLVLSVVRWPQDWTQRLVDRNVPALAPPEDLLTKFKRVRDAAEEDGCDDPERIAWEQFDFGVEYRSYLDRRGPQEVLDTLEEKARERHVWLVCWEGDDTYCHRRILADRLRERLPEREQPDPCSPGAHELETTPRGAPDVMECATCGYSLQSLVDHFGQDISRISTGATVR